MEKIRELFLTLLPHLSMPEEDQYTQQCDKEPMISLSMCKMFYFRNLTSVAVTIILAKQIYFQLLTFMRNMGDMLACVTVRR